MPTDFDATVIGSGPGGEVAASRLLAPPGWQPRGSGPAHRGHRASSRPGYLRRSPAVIPRIGLGTLSRLAAPSSAAEPRSGEIEPHNSEISAADEA